MKQLILYSDFKFEQCELVDERLVAILDKPDPKIGYIPSDSDLKRQYFEKVVDHYQQLGIYDVMYFDLKDEFDKSRIPELLRCDAIHLSGGDIYHFLALLRLRNFGQILSKFLDDGGILVGVSAGAMIFTPTIGLCNFFDNLKLKPAQVKSFGFVDFEFFPHFDGGQKTLKRLCEYSQKFNKIIYACDDSSGIIFEENRVELLGPVVKIEGGLVK